MSKMVWDQTGERRYETGVEQVALYPLVEGAYPKGVAWNGITALNLTPSGAEPTALYANNRKYLTLMSVEEMAYTVEAYTYPDEWNACNGYVEKAPGFYVTQQTRMPFGLVAKTNIGNDTEQTKFGYKLHILYNGLASPSEMSHATINEDPEAATLSWEVNTTPVPMNGFDSTSYICIDSTKVNAEKLAALEAVLYGSDDVEPRLPLPDEIATMMSEEVAG